MNGIVQPTKCDHGVLLTEVCWQCREILDLKIIGDALKKHLGLNLADARLKSIWTDYSASLDAEWLAVPRMWTRAMAETLVQSFDKRQFDKLAASRGVNVPPAQPGAVYKVPNQVYVVNRERFENIMGPLKFTNTEVLDGVAGPAKYDALKEQANQAIFDVLEQTKADMRARANEAAERFALPVEYQKNSEGIAYLQQRIAEELDRERPLARLKRRIIGGERDTLIAAGLDPDTLANDQTLRKIEFQKVQQRISARLDEAERDALKRYGLDPGKGIRYTDPDLEQRQAQVDAKERRRLAEALEQQREAYEQKILAAYGGGAVDGGYAGVNRAQQSFWLNNDQPRMERRKSAPVAVAPVVGTGPRRYFDE